MRITDYIKLNTTNPEDALLKVDYKTLLPMFDKIYTQVYEGDVLFIDFPYMDKQYVELSRKYYMEGVADLTAFIMDTIHEIVIDRKEHKFKKIRPVVIDTGKTTFITGEARGGKSSLALWLAYSLYGDWDVALAHIVIDPLQLDDIVDAMRTYGIRKIPLIIIDDAGLGFGKQVGKIDRIRLEKLHKYAQVWSIIFNNVLMTIQSESRLSSVILNTIKVTYNISVAPKTTTVSESHVYKNTINALDKRLKRRYPLRDYNSINVGLLLKKKLKDEYAHVVYTPRLIPDEAYVKYRQLREDYVHVISKWKG
jgi:hypothetical protein